MEKKYFNYKRRKKMNNYLIKHLINNNIKNATQNEFKSKHKMLAILIGVAFLLN
jgi:hypothetical protein